MEITHTSQNTLFQGTYDAITIATITIAIFAILAFVQQTLKNRNESSIARANYKLALFEKRLKLYFSIEDYLKIYMRDGQPSLSDALRLRYEARTAHFLFPKEALTFIDEVVAKAAEYKRNFTIHEPLRERAYAREELTSDEERTMNDALDKMHEIEEWHHKQIEYGKLRNTLEPYLQLPESV